MVRERRDFIELTPIERMRLIDALCSNLSVLSASVTAAVVSGASADEAHAETMFGYRQALKAYATFIFHVCEVCEKESKECAAMACAQKPAPGAKGKKKQTNKAKLAEWAWDDALSMLRLLRSGRAADSTFDSPMRISRVSGAQERTSALLELLRSRQPGGELYNEQLRLATLRGVNDVAFLGFWLHLHSRSPLRLLGKLNSTANFTRLMHILALRKQRH